MIIDNTAGLQFFLTEDIYLLTQDKDKLHIPVNETQDEKPEPIPEVTVTPVAVSPVTEPPLQFKYLGNNAKNFVILCNYPNEGQMDDKHLTALTSALQRKELALEDVAILNMANYANATVNQLTQYFKPARLLLLGSPCLLNGWDKLPFNQLQHIGPIKALYTYSFTEMLGDRDKTKAFWEQMKQL